MVYLAAKYRTIFACGVGISKFLCSDEFISLIPTVYLL
jgi:hypothetical protein